MWEMTSYKRSNSMKIPANVKKKKKKNQQRLKIKTLMTEIAVPKYSNE